MPKTPDITSNYRRPQPISSYGDSKPPSRRRVLGGIGLAALGIAAPIWTSRIFGGDPALTQPQPRRKEPAPAPEPKPEKNFYGNGLGIANDGSFYFTNNPEIVEASASSEPYRHSLSDDNIPKGAQEPPPKIFHAKRVFGPKYKGVGHIISGNQGKQIDDIGNIDVKINGKPITGGEWLQRTNPDGTDFLDSHGRKAFFRGDKITINRPQPPSRG